MIAYPRAVSSDFPFLEFAGGFDLQEVLDEELRPAVVFERPPVKELIGMGRVVFEAGKTLALDNRLSAERTGLFELKHGPSFLFRAHGTSERTLIGLVISHDLHDPLAADLVGFLDGGENFVVIVDERDVRILFVDRAVLMDDLDLADIVYRPVLRVLGVGFGVDSDCVCNIYPFDVGDFLFRRNLRGLGNAESSKNEKGKNYENYPYHPPWIHFFNLLEMRTSKPRQASAMRNIVAWYATNTN